MFSLMVWFLFLVSGVLFYIFYFWDLEGSVRWQKGSVVGAVALVWSVAMVMVVWVVVKMVKSGGNSRRQWGWSVVVGAVVGWGRGGVGSGYGQVGW